MKFLKNSNVEIGLKLVFIGSVVVVLLIGLWSIRWQLDKRESTYNYAQMDIFHSAGDEFSLEGPYLDIPVLHTWYTEFTSYDGKTRREKHEETTLVTIKANEARMQAELASEMRSIGIYSAPVYTGNLALEAGFIVDLEDSEGYEYQLDKAQLYIVSGKKNLTSQPLFTVNGTAYTADLLSDYAASDNIGKNSTAVGIICPVQRGSNTLSAAISFRGANKFAVLPAARSSSLSISADWTSPNFTGFDYLPDSRSLSDTGFTATWNIPFSGTSAVGFRYVQPVDLYTQLERAFKYGFLFIIVPFLVLFLFELFAHVVLHPMHYLLCGAACVIFFLLLLSFSEHLPFLASYLIGSSAAALLVSFYVASVTGRARLGATMAGLFALLYAYLYFSLKSEDYAFLIGSVFIFLVLASVMFLTRKVDWNALSRRGSAA